MVVQALLSRGGFLRCNVSVAALGKIKNKEIRKNEGFPVDEKSLLSNEKEDVEFTTLEHSSLLQRAYSRYFEHITVVIYKFDSPLLY